MSPVSSSSGSIPISVPVVHVGTDYDCCSQIDSGVQQDLDLSAPHHKIVNVPITNAITKKRKTGACYYNRKYRDLQNMVRFVVANMDNGVCRALQQQFINSTLDIKNLFIVSNLLKCKPLNTCMFLYINDYIIKRCARCNTDEEKERILTWIPDAVKCRLKIMKHLHGEQFLNVVDLIKGTLSVDCVQKAFEILCLYTSSRHCTAVLGRYKVVLSVFEFHILKKYQKQIFDNRTKGILTVMSHVQTFNAPSMDLIHSIDNVSDSVSEAPQNHSQHLLETSFVKSKIYSAKNSSYVHRTIRKVHEKLSPKVAEFKDALMKGSLNPYDILSTREFLLRERVSTYKVCRWFRIYRDKISSSISISDEDKKKILTDIEISKKTCRSVVKRMHELDYDTEKVIQRMQTGDVELCEIKDIRTCLNKKIGADRTSRLFVKLKADLLKKHTNCIDQIQRAFSYSRQRNVRDLNDNECRLLQSFNDGSVPLEKLSESINSLFKVRRYMSVTSAIVRYVQASISYGVQPSLILSHLPERFRTINRVIMALNPVDHGIIQDLKHGSLPFERLEEAANVAVKYFSPYMVFGLLLRYAYREKSLIVAEQISFRSLLVSLEAEGVVSMKRPVSKFIQIHSGSYDSIADPVSDDVPEMFYQGAECTIEQDGMNLQSVYFEDMMADTMVRSGVDVELQQTLELEVGEQTEFGLGLMYDVEMTNEELLCVFND